MNNTLNPPRLGFIGAGNMARALAGGLLASGWPRENLQLSDPSPDQHARIRTELGLTCGSDNRALADQCDVLLFAVKPQHLRAVATAMKDHVQARHPLIVSIAAGVRSADLERWLGDKLPVVRCMPNTPALVGAGASALSANDLVTQPQRDLVEKILRAVGVTVWVDRETQMDTVTALSGSGPAYFLRFIEAMENAATDLGLSSATARQLTLHTAAGAARLALSSHDDPATLRRQVTSPGGTTEQALRVFEEGDLEGLVKRAIRAAEARGREMADQLGVDQTEKSA